MHEVVTIETPGTPARTIPPWRAQLIVRSTAYDRVALVITSLTLVTLEHWPETSQDWVHLGSTITLLALSLVAAIVRGGA